MACLLRNASLGIFVLRPAESVTLDERFRPLISEPVLIGGIWLS